MSARSSASSSRGRGEFIPGDRVVTGGRHGVVRFSGTVQFATGKYIGIELDAAEGKHDGSMKGVRYFQCPPNHGVFVKPSMVTLVAEADPNAAPVPAASVSATTASSNTLAPPSAPASKAHSRTSSRKVSMDVTATAAAHSSTATSSHTTSTAAAAAPASISSSTSTTPPSPAASHLPTPGRTSHAGSTHHTPSKLSHLQQALESKAALKEGLAGSGVPLSPPGKSMLGSAISPPSLRATGSGHTTPVGLARTGHGAISPPPPPTAASAELQRAYDALQATHTQRGVEFQQLQNRVTQLEQDKKKLTDDVSKLNQELSARDKLVASLRTELSEKDSSSSQVESLQTMVEMLTLDKALAEEQYESAQMELTNWNTKYTNLELEHQLLQEQYDAIQMQMQQQQQRQQQSASSPPADMSTASSASTDPATAAVSSSAAQQKLLEQNQLLADALRKLRDLNLSEKQRYTQRIAELEKAESDLVTTTSENEALRSELSTALASITELKAQLDDAGDLQSMVEALSSAKMDLEEQLKTHERSIAYLQSLVEASEEVEEGYKDLHQQLQREVEAAEANLVDLNTRYKLKMNQIEDLNNTNRKFRQLVRQLESENQSLKSRLIEVGAGGAVGSEANGSGVRGAVTRADATSSPASSSSLLTLRLKQVRTAHLDKLMSQLDVSLVEKRCQFLSLYLPPNVSIDDRSISFLQLLERVRGKSTMLAQVWAEFYGGVSSTGSLTAMDAGSHTTSSSALVARNKLTLDFSAAGSSPELALLSFRACLLVASLIHALDNLTASLYPLDTESYDALALRAQSELSTLEHILDSYINMVAMDTLNEVTSLQSLVHANNTLYTFITQRVPVVAHPNDKRSLQEQATAVMPYRMSLWSVMDSGDEHQASEENKRWTELQTTYEQRLSTAKPAASSASSTSSAASDLAPSSLPSLSTFALTLSYSAALSHTSAQTISDQLNQLCESMRRGRKKKRMESEDEKIRKERQEQLAESSEAEVDTTLSTTTNTALADYSPSNEDPDIALYPQSWSDLADATLNNLSLAHQLQHTAVSNYLNSLGAVNSPEQERAKEEECAKLLLPHIHAIDELSHRTTVELNKVMRALAPLLQADQLNDISSNMSAEPPAEDAAHTPSHPVLQQVLSILQRATSKGADGSDSLLDGVNALRAQLLHFSKKLMQIIEENSSSGTAMESDGSAAMAVRARHQRATSLILTAPEHVQAGILNNNNNPETIAAELSTVQPWFHHPLTIRSQLSATASLRVQLQDLSSRLGEKQKELYAAHKSISEERAKHEVLVQQLQFHTNKSGQYAELTLSVEKLRAKLAESEKTIEAARAQLEKITRENQVLRKQMLQLKAHYMKQEERNRAQAAAAAANTASAQGGGMVAGGLISGGAVNLSSMSTANLNDIMLELDLLRRTLAAQREETAYWKNRQSLHELETGLLPPLPAFDVDTATKLQAKPLLMQSMISKRSSASHTGSVIESLLPPELGWKPTTFQQSKLIGSVDPARNPLIAALPPPPHPHPRKASSSSASAAISPTQCRQLVAQVSEVANKLWQARVTPRIVKLQDVDGERKREEEESKRKEAAENEEHKTDAETSSEKEKPGPTRPSLTPFQQYFQQRVHAVQLQQYCEKLTERVNRLADQQRSTQWAGGM